MVETQLTEKRLSQVMTQQTDLLIDAQDVSLRINERDILDRVALQVHVGEIVTLIGPNGAGKSTLLKVLLGLLACQHGRVARRPGLRIGYMPQRLKINPLLPLSVRRFLTLARKLPEDKIVGALKETGAHYLIDQPMDALSGGETQRVLLSRAILSDPELLILDEPVQGVDVTGQDELYRLISTIRRRHDCGILMVSHDLHLVMSATDRVVCLNHHVCCAGHPERIQQDPSYIALFGRNAAVMPYNHHHDHRHDIHNDVVTGPRPGPRNSDRDDQAHG